MKLVLDTSALISAVRSNFGAAAEVLRFTGRGEVELLMDYKLSCEYHEVALRPEHVHRSGKSPAEITSLILALEVAATPVLVTERYRPLSNDPDDDMVLDVAINGGADVIVTSNVRDFRTAALHFDIQVLTPKEFLKQFRNRG